MADPVDQGHDARRGLAEQPVEEARAKGQQLVGPNGMLAEITKLVGTSAWYAPGQAAAEMCEAILKDKKKILPCSVFLQGEYGIHDLFVGVPVKLGSRGVEQIIEIKLTAEEDAALKKSAASVKELTDVIGV